MIDTWYARGPFYVLCIHIDPTNEEPVFIVPTHPERWGHPAFWCGERYGLGCARGFIPMNHYERTKK